MKKWMAFLLVFTVLIHTQVTVRANTDVSILIDPVSASYEGRQQATSIIQSMAFQDVPADFWGREAIMRMGALDIIKGDGQRRAFRPNDPVSNEEALAFILRAVGLEAQAQIEAERIAPTLANRPGLEGIWSLGYMQLAQRRGLLTRAELNDALSEDQSSLDPAINFMRRRPATREQVAEWMVKAINATDETVLVPVRGQHKIYEFADWRSITAEKVPYVEAAAQSGIMQGGAARRFDPLGRITRAQMAQMIKNIDEIYFKTMQYIRKTGTMASVQDQQHTTTGAAKVSRSMRIRTDQGLVEEIRYTIQRNVIGQTIEKDVPVYTNRQLSGLASLQLGDAIEYIVQPATGAVLYINRLHGLQHTKVQGVLQPLEVAQGMISIKDATGKVFTYPMIQGLYRINLEDETSYIYIEGKEMPIERAPVSRRVELSLKNNVVDHIKPIGEAVLYKEIQGIITENNPNLAYLTMINSEGKQETKAYYKKTLKVEKQQYYDQQDEIGYIDDIFPDFRFDPRDASIEDLEEGDIVFLRLDKDGNITKISAVTNYTTQYGKIKRITKEGSLGTRFLLEYENLSTGWVDVPHGIFVSKEGRPISTAQIEPGDWVKILVNQAVLQPGHVSQVVKEVMVEGDEHFITNIYRGQLAGYDEYQKKLKLQNAEAFHHMGWKNRQQVQYLDLTGQEVEYYNEGKRISQGQARQYLTRSDGEAYVAMEKYYDKERVKKVTFRFDREEFLNTDHVVHADGIGAFKIGYLPNTIKTDAGTIVRRYGRLVDPHNIMIPDYAKVVLNGENKAAIVDIGIEPTINGIQVFRGRVMAIDEGRSFHVSSFSALTDMTWSPPYPIARVFPLDYNTKFYDATGMVDANTFIGYTSATKLGEVFTIITQGTKTLAIIDNPFVKDGVKGTIYKVDGDKVYIKNTLAYNQKGGTWSAISNLNSAVEVELQPNTIMIKNSQPVSKLQLEEGDRIRVMKEFTTTPVTSGSVIKGYIIFVEK